MSSNESKSPFPAKGNPYSILSLPDFATAAQIKKKFRTLSLKFHPDKREKNLTKAQHDELDHQFIAVQEARDFLLKDEFREEKEKYDAKLKSESIRKEEEKKRDAAMSSKRKRMREDLESKIQNLGKKAKQDSDIKDTNSNVYQDLKRDGMKMREAFGQKHRTAEEKLAARERKQKKQKLEYRQVRLKWSRKKMGGQSEDMLIKLMKVFGTVEDIELIGSKGNSALVTFQDSSSCKPCVEKYKHSNEMRASYVGSRKDEEDQGFEINNDEIPDSSLHRDRDRESVEERKLRQAAEREVLLRKMEMGEDIDIDTKSVDRKSNAEKGKMAKPPSLFPPKFPATKPLSNIQITSPLERLQQLESEILDGLLSTEELEGMRIHIST